MSRAIAILGVLLACACSAPVDRTCVLEPGPTQSTRLRCPGDPPLILPREVERVPTGRVVGVVRRFGLDENEQIDVRSVQTPDFARTAADGTWALEDVIPGPYQLRVSAPAYQAINVSRFLVLPGTTFIRPITLYVSRQMLPDTVDTLRLSPRKDAFLAEGHGSLQLFDAGRFEVFALAAEAKDPQFTPDGAFVYLSEVGTPQRLMRWNVDDASMEVIDRDVTDWVLARDDRTVVYVKREPPPVSLDDLMVWQEGSKEPQAVERGVGNWAVYNGNMVAALYSQSPQVLLAWDIAAAAGANLGPASDLPFEVAPDGNSFVFRNAAQEVQLFDGLATAGVQDLGGKLPACAVLLVSGCRSFSPDGRMLLLQDTDDGTTWLRLLTRRKDVPLDPTGTPVQPPVQPPEFSADGSQVLLVRRSSIDVYDVASGETRSVAAGRTIVSGSARFLPRGDGVVFAAAPQVEGAPAGAEWTYVWSGGVTQVAAEENTTRIFSPEGGAMAVAGAALWLTDLDHGVFGRRIAERSQEGVEHARFSTDGAQLAFVVPDVEDDRAGALHILDRATGADEEVAPHTAAGFRYTASGDLVFIQRFVGVAGWGRLSVLNAAQGRVAEISSYALWDTDHPIVVSENGKRVLFHVVRPDAELRLVYVDLDDARPIPVDTVGQQGTRPLITDTFLLYRVGGSRPGWYVSLYPDETPQGFAEVDP